MRLPRPFVRSLILCGWPLTPTLVNAQAPDVIALPAQWEDQVLDGDKDAEDVAAFRFAPEAAGGRGRASTYVALEGFAGRRTFGEREIGGLLVLQVPLERLVGRPRGPRADQPVASAESAPLLGFQAPTAPVRSAGADAGAASPAATRANAVVVDLAVARACVSAALRAVNLTDDARLDSMAARARSSAALPELRLRAMRTADESGRVTQSDLDPSHFTETGATTDWLEARLTFRLDRLLFADDEVAIERIRVERSEQRSRVAARALEVLFEWQRAYLLEQDPDLGTDQHLAALVRELEAGARLDVMTDGWFARFRSGLKGLPP